MGKNFIYNGKAQSLLSNNSKFSDLLGDCKVVCSIEDGNGDIKIYELDEKNLSSVSLRDAGLYKIKFSVVGDNNYEDFESDEIEISVAKIDLEKDVDNYYLTKKDNIYDSTKQELFNAPKKNLPYGLVLLYKPTGTDKKFWRI